MTSLQIPDMPARLVRSRNGLGNVLEKLHAGETVAIAYFGSSISNSNWCKENIAWFKTAYPKGEIKAIKAAIGATGSALGVFRVREHVLRHKPDLIFVEFSINDDDRPPADVCRDLEGIVRQVWKADPLIDICLVHMFRPRYAPALRVGQCTASQSAHERLADYYGIPSINVSLRINELVEAGKLRLSAPQGTDGRPETAPDGAAIYSIGDGVHPGDEGSKVIARAVAEGLVPLFASSSPGRHPLKPPLIPGNPMEHAKLAPLDPKMLSAGWVKLDDTANRFGRLFSERGGGQYKMSGVWEANRPGESIRFRFKGTGIGLYDLRGMDAGQVTVNLDGQAVESPGGLLGFSRVHPDYWPCAMLIAEDLEDKEHAVEIIIGSEPPDRRAVMESARERPGFDPKQYEGTFIRVARILVVGDILSQGGQNPGSGRPGTSLSDSATGG